MKRRTTSAFYARVAGTRRRTTALRAFWFPAWLVLVFLRWTSVPELHAQGPAAVGEWSCPVNLAAARPGKGFYPTLVSDTAGGLHVFWDEVIGDQSNQQIWVVYAYWDGTNWSEPIDVFGGTGGWQSAWGAQAFVDGNGVLHTFWIDGYSLQYAQRHVSSPVSARSWLGRVTLAASRGRLGPLAVAFDDAGILHVLYLDAGAVDAGIYYLYSEDRGEAWSSPQRISEPGTIWSQAIQRYVLDVLALGDTLHAAWVQGDPDQQVFYARDLERGTQWSPPRLVLQEGNWPNFVSLEDGRLLMVATGSLPDDLSICFKLQSESPDGGTTWNVHKILMPHIKGCLGLINVVRDNGGTFRLITSAYRPDEYPGSPGQQRYGIWHSRWDGRDWSIPQLIVWPQVSYRDLGTQIDFPHAAISEGNILHVAFHVDEGRVWYTRCSLPVARASLTAFPGAPVSAGQHSPTAADTLATPSPPLAAAIAAHLPQEAREVSGESPHTSHSVPPLVIGLAGSLVVLGIGLGWKSVRRRLP